MSEAMKITVGRFDAATCTVPVIFELGDKSHSRAVNAVIGDDGKHDRAATMARVDEVAAGVANKFAESVVGAKAGDRIRYNQYTDSMYFAPMVPYLRSWAAATRATRCCRWPPPGPPAAAGPAGRTGRPGTPPGNECGWR